MKSRCSTKQYIESESGPLDLNSVYLASANLSGANLSRAYLIGADLSGANLFGADLSRVNVTSIKYSDSTRWPPGFTPPPSR